MNAYLACATDVASSVSVIVIGAGQAGLAMSRCLAQRSIDHLVLERGQVANAWRRQRWDSLRLLTPNWQSCLPGLSYDGDDPDGFMTAAEVAGFIDRYAALIDAPVKTGVTVLSVQRHGEHYRVITDQQVWYCKAVVIASGAFSLPQVPAVGQWASAAIDQLHARDYRNPQQLAQAGVLVVGGSASGLQLAAEIQKSGRPVTLAVGEHVRVPRSYRGRDIQWWMHQMGILDEHYREVDDLQRARKVPSPQLIGSPERADLDLNGLQSVGVKVVGRLMGLDGDRAQFSGSLRNVCALADLKMERLLKRIDDWVVRHGLQNALPSSRQSVATRVDASPCLGLSLERQNIGSIVWATGYKPDYSWLELPVFDRRGRLRHDGGVVAAAGIYVLGLPFMRRRKSSFIHGVGDDARDLSAHLQGYLHSIERRFAVKLNATVSA